MIFIGFDKHKKDKVICDYFYSNNVSRVVIISNREYDVSVFDFDCEAVLYKKVIEYIVFYRLLQEIDQNTLVIINECLRTQNRYDLSYNCIRNYLTRTNHVLVFQMFPQIDTHEDFMILFDFATGSKWKRKGFDIDLIKRNTTVIVDSRKLSFSRINIETSLATKTKYEKARACRFSEIGMRDPNTIPRNLHLIGGTDKLAYIIENTTQTLFNQDIDDDWYVARNKRLKHERILTYSEISNGSCRRGVKYSIIDVPHRFIDFSDFVTMTRQFHNSILVADLKVDKWYCNRIVEWGNRINETITDLS